MRALVIALGLWVFAAASCGGGAYAKRDLVDDEQRGDTNGKSFDFVSHKPNGGEWTFRLRGRSLWVAYSTADEEEDLGTHKLTDREFDDLWIAIEALDLAGRKRGLPDKFDGTYTLRQRDPGDVEHDLYLVYVSRATEEEAVLEFVAVLEDIVEEHTGEKPNL